MSKNGLTNRNYSDRIIKLSRDSAQQNKSRKKLEKSLKKYLTNEFCCDMINKLPKKMGEQISRKKLQKLLKKYLTSEKFGDIITKLSARAGGELDLEN